MDFPSRYLVILRRARVGNSSGGSKRCRVGGYIPPMPDHSWTGRQPVLSHQIIAYERQIVGPEWVFRDKVDPYDKLLFVFDGWVRLSESAPTGALGADRQRRLLAGDVALVPAHLPVTYSGSPILDKMHLYFGLSYLSIPLALEELGSVLATTFDPSALLAVAGGGVVGASAAAAPQTPGACSAPAASAALPAPAASPTPAARRATAAPSAGPSVFGAGSANETEGNAGTLLNPLMLDSLVGYHIGRILVPVADRLSQIARRLDRYAEVDRVLAERPPFQVRVRDLAREIGMGESTLSRNFHRDTGQTLKAYLKDTVVRRSKRCLAGSASVREIAGILGFEDEFYFSKYFKRETGFSPRAYRRSLAERIR